MLSIFALQMEFSSKKSQIFLGKKVISKGNEKRVAYLNLLPNTKIFVKIKFIEKKSAKINNNSQQN